MPAQRFALLSHAFLAALACGIVLATAWPSQAADRYWARPEGDAGDWADAANWGGSLPGATDTAYIDNNGTAQVTSTPPQVDQINVGDAATGTLEHSAGALTVTRSMGVGRSDGSQGTYRLSGSARLNAKWLALGPYGGVGTVEQSGGTCAIAQSLMVGWVGGPGGEYHLSGGTLTAREIYAGDYDPFFGPGQLEQTGGTVTAEYLGIGPDATWTFTGGSTTLSIGGRVRGTADFGIWGTPRLHVTGGVFDLSTARLQHAYRLAYVGGANSLLIYPPGTNPQTLFGSYANAGCALESGGSVTIPAGRTICGRGVVSGHVTVMGTLAANADADKYHANQMELVGGLTVAGGSADFRHDGSVYLNDLQSSISSGHIYSYIMYVGHTAPAKFVQSGGTVETVHEIYVGQLEVPATYQMSGGSLRAMNVYLGAGSQAARFIQTGGTVSAAVTVGIGNGTYELGGSGQCASRYLVLGTGALFRQRGGTNTISVDLILRGPTGGSATYELAGGTLNLKKLTRQGDGGRFIVSGGVLNVTGTNPVAVDSCVVGGQAGPAGTFCLTHGELQSQEVRVGDYGHGEFAQTPGTSVVTQHLAVGAWSGSWGRYTIEGGLLATAQCVVGEGGTGILGIESADADITISAGLTFGPGTHIASVPGGTIRFTGSSFENQSTHPSGLADLANLVFQFEGGSQDVDPFEVAGADVGRRMEGFNENFALGTLRVGTQAGEVGQVRLVDLFDNQQNGPGDEALYVETLFVGPGALLDLNGLNLYYQNSTFDPGATILGGTPTWVPEPATLALVAIGAAALLRRRR